MPAQPEDIILRPPSLDIWTLKPSHDGHVLQWSPVADIKVPIGTVSSTREATSLAQRFLQDVTVSFDRHLWLDAPHRLWASGSDVTKQAAKILLRQKSHARAQAEIEGRQHRWRQQDPEIADALDTLTWTEIANMRGVIDPHRTLMLRLKGDRLSKWDRTQRQPGCPHCPDLGSLGGTSAHVFWACTRAQQLWTQMLHHWSPLWSPEHAPDLPEAKAAYFSLHLPAAPDLLWSNPSMARLPLPTVDATIATHAAVNAAWRQHALVVLYTIWIWRTTPETAEDLWPPDHAAAVLQIALVSSLRDLRWARTDASAATPHTAIALRLLCEPRSPSPRPTRLSPGHDRHYLLFFDRGSRGNPGPGGAGAVVVRLTPDNIHAEVIFSAAIAFADPTTTNNQVEYEGLIAGLTAAAEHHWTPLSVIGDSMLIIRQMKTYKPPLNVTLQRKYAQARRLADSLGVRGWGHHPRVANKMADAAANLAMDDNVSSLAHHPTDQERHQHVAELLPGDLEHWREGNT